MLVEYLCYHTKTHTIQSISTPSVCQKKTWWSTCLIAIDSYNSEAPVTHCSINLAITTVAIAVAVAVAVTVAALTVTLTVAVTFTLAVAVAVTIAATPLVL